MALLFGRKTKSPPGSRLLDDEGFYRVLEANPARQKIVITRRYYLPESDRIHWIYLSKVPHRNHFDPSKLYVLEQTVWKLLQNESSDVILDAFEYIMIENGPEAALKFTGKLRDIAVLTDSDFYVTVSDALDERTRHMLSRIVE